MGYDAHQFTEGRPLILGGVQVPHSCGLLGHSDADVLVHAVCDALLGAAALGDIGRHFPDSDDRYRGISSLVLLEESTRLVRRAGYRPVNADCVVVAQRPKLAPHIPRMCARIAAAMGLGTGAVNVKATTTEGLGFAGRKEGIAAYAVVLIERTSERSSRGAETAAHEHCHG